IFLLRVSRFRLAATTASVGTASAGIALLALYQVRSAAGFVDKIIDPKVLAIGLILEVEGCVAYLRGKDHEYEDVRDIELPNPAIERSRRAMPPCRCSALP